MKLPLARLFRNIGPGSTSRRGRRAVWVSESDPWFSRSRGMAFLTSVVLIVIAGLLAGALAGFDVVGSGLRADLLAGTLVPLAVVVILFVHARTQERLDMRAGRPSLRSNRASDR